MLEQQLDETTKDNNYYLKKIEEMQNTFALLKEFEPFLYTKIIHTGDIAKSIGKALDIIDFEFYFSGYYANISLLSMVNLYKKDDFLTKNEIFTMKRHPILSSEYASKLGLQTAANIIKYHHEKPNASGYFKEQDYPKESAYIEIADNFSECFMPRNYRPKYTLNEALQETLSVYKNSIFLSNQEIEAITDKLIIYYGDNFN